MTKVFSVRAHALILGLCAVGAPLLASEPPDHTVVLILENRSCSQIIGNPDAPYLNSLAQDGALCVNYYANTHPSQPNYFELFSGSNQGVQDNSNPAPGSPYSTPNLASALEAVNRTFASFSEGMPAVGYTGPNFQAYTRLVNPCVSWQASTPGPNQISPQLNKRFIDFPSGDYTQLPFVSFVVPTLGHSMHDNSIASGDAWLQQNIGPYAAWAMTHNSLLIITFDEDQNLDRNHIPTIFYGPMVRVGMIDATCTHHNLLRTLCDLAGAVPPGNAAYVSPIPGVFGSDHLSVRRAFRQGDGGYASAHDTWLDPNGPNLNKGSVNVLFAGNTREALFRFDNLFGTDAAQVPPGAAILSARLNLVTGNDLSRDTFSLHRMLVPWTDSSTWNSLGGGVSPDDVEAASVPEFQLIPNYQNMVVSFDVTEAVQGWSNGSVPNLGFLIRAEATDVVQFRSSEASSLDDRPTLEIVYDAGDPCVSFTHQPASQSVLRGHMAVFSVDVAATGSVVFKWTRNGIPIEDGGPFAGTDTTTLQIYPADFDLSGTYSAMAVASCATIYSVPATLTVVCDNVPAITAQPPALITVDGGSSIDIGAAASFSGSVQFHWEYALSDTFTPLSEGGNYAGVATPTLHILQAGASESGSFRLVVSSDCADAVSNSCLVIVNCHADYNGNGFVNGDDYDDFSMDFTLGNAAADYDGNGFVNGDDFDLFSVDFQNGC